MPSNPAGTGMLPLLVRIDIKQADFAEAEHLPQRFFPVPHKEGQRIVLTRLVKVPAGCILMLKIPGYPASCKMYSV